MHGRLETTGAAPLRARRAAPGARCALPGVRGRVRRCPGSVPPSTSPLSKPPRLCLCLCPPTPRLRLPPLRASTPTGRTGSGAPRGAGCGAGGGRGQSRGRGAGAGRPGLSVGCGDAAAEKQKGGDCRRGMCGARGGGGDFESGRLSGDWGDRGWAGESGLGDPAGGARLLRAAHAGCTAGLLRAHVPT